MRNADVVTGQTYQNSAGYRCVVLEKNVRETGYRGAPRTNVRVRWEHNGVEASIPARELEPTAHTTGDSEMSKRVVHAPRGRHLKIHVASEAIEPPRDDLGYRWGKTLCGSDYNRPAQVWGDGQEMAYTERRPATLADVDCKRCLKALTTTGG
jgi:hypothetical protein